MKATAIGITVALLVGIAVYLGYQRISDNRFACTYPDFDRIENEMTAEEVAEVLGQPDEKVVKEELGGDRFGQGELEQQITSGWLYDLPDWDGGLEVYFDVNEKVVGKNCGNG